MAPSRLEQARLWLFTFYVLGVSAPLKTLEWIVRGPRPLSWSLRTTLIIHMFKSFVAKEGIGFLAPPKDAPPPEAFDASEGLAMIEFGETPEAPPPPEFPPEPTSDKARFSETKVDGQGYRVTGATVPLHAHASFIGPPIHPFSHTYPDPKTGQKVTVEVKPKNARVYWIAPPEDVGDYQNGGSKMVVMAMHGGGYVSGWPLFPNFYRIARRAKIPVLSVHYRLGKKPRSRFPAPIQDAAVAYSYLLNECGYKPEQIVFMGDSAGGGLASALCIYLVWRRLPLPGKLCLLSPWVDLTESHESLTTSPIDYIQPVNFHFATRRYVRGDERLRTSPLVSPEQADWKRIGASVRKHGQAWPETFVTWGEFEALRDEGESLARKMAQDGGFGDKVRTLAWKDMIHDFTFLPIPESADLREVIVDWMMDQWDEAKVSQWRAPDQISAKL